jgi:hypothetical protein
MAAGNRLRQLREKSWLAPAKSPRASVNDPHQMVCQEDDLQRLCGVGQINVSVRIRVLVRTDSAAKQLHAADLLAGLGG